jgi:fumarylpyruvate hydrolase
MTSQATASYAFAPPPVPSVEIAGSSQRFPVHRIYCVGRNYADHALEMGVDPKADPPVFFTKPADAIVASGETIPYPSRTSNLHYEVELVVALGPGGHIFGYAVGNDLTRRDLQGAAKKKGQPWDIGKAFDFSAPIGSIRAIEEGNIDRGKIWLTVNGETRQQADISDMIWNVPAIIAELSTLFALQAGDLIYTGTPAGVGPLNPGDRIECGIDGLEILRTNIGAR